MTADDLRALSVAATPAPWVVDESLIDGSPMVGGPWPLVVALEIEAASDAELIVWLRNHADALADFIDAVHAFRDELRQDPDGTWVAHGPTVDRIDSAIAALDADA